MPPVCLVGPKHMHVLDVSGSQQTLGSCPEHILPDAHTEGLRLDLCPVAFKAPSQSPCSILMTAISDGGLQEGFYYPILDARKQKSK